MANILDKIGGAITNETLGEVDSKVMKKNKKDAKKEEQAAKKTVKRTSKQSTEKPTTKKNTKTNIPKPVFSVEEPAEPVLSERVSNMIDITQNKGKYPALKILNIDFEPTVANLITPTDIDNATFTITAPTGLSADEVEQFCDTVQRDIAVYQSIIAQRQQDFLKLLEHTNDLAEKLADQKEESELANFILDSKSKEDSLKERLADLQIENAELKAEIDKLKHFTSSALPKMTDEFVENIIEDTAKDKNTDINNKDKSTEKSNIQAGKSNKSKNKPTKRDNAQAEDDIFDDLIDDML